MYTKGVKNDNKATVSESDSTRNVSLKGILTSVMNRKQKWRLKHVYILSVYYIS